MGDFSTMSLRDLSLQQQLLDVLIVRRGRGRFTGRLPDGLENLRPHNLVTFKSHHEALTPWAMKELTGLDVAYRKYVSPSPSDLLPDDHFGLYAVAARFPHNLAALIPWQQRQPGVYDCRWGTDTIRVLVAGELPREPHNAPLHLFSASPELVAFGSGAYRRRSQDTSALLRQLLERFQGEGLTMTYTMEDFMRQYAKEHFHELTPEEQAEALQALPPEKQQEVFRAFPPESRLAGLSPEQIREYLDRLTAGKPAVPRKPRRRK